MPSLRLLVLLLVTPLAVAAAQQPTAPPSTSTIHHPAARPAAPAQRRDTTAQRFVAIRRRYQTELNTERAALQRTRDRMREDLIAAGWRPRRMRARQFSARFARMRQRDGRGAMMGQRRGLAFGGRGMMMRRRPPMGMQRGPGMAGGMPAPGTAMGRPGMTGPGGRPGLMGARRPMNGFRSDSVRMRPTPRDTTGRGW